MPFVTIRYKIILNRHNQVTYLWLTELANSNAYKVQERNFEMSKSKYMLPVVVAYMALGTAFAQTSETQAATEAAAEARAAATLAEGAESGSDAGRVAAEAALTAAIEANRAARQARRAADMGIDRDVTESRGLFFLWTLSAAAAPQDGEQLAVGAGARCVARRPLWWLRPRVGRVVVEADVEVQAGARRRRVRHGVVVARPLARREGAVVRIRAHAPQE